MNRIILFLFLLPLISWQEDNNEDSILWNAERKLSWADFKGQPKPEGYFKALTNYGITTMSKFSNTEIEFNISTYFYPSGSWVDPEFKFDVLLKHEQLHFDIAELYARKLRKKAGELNYKIKTASQQLQAISSENQQSLHRTQEQYDKETKHSLVESKQIEWQTKIAKQLKELEAFNNPIVKAAVKK